MPTATPLQPEGRGLAPIYQDGPAPVISEIPTLTPTITATPTAVPTIMSIHDKSGDLVGVGATLFTASLAFATVAVATHKVLQRR